MISSSNLGGALTRGPEGWTWTATGDPEPLVFDSFLAFLVPEFRRQIVHGVDYFLIPSDWRWASVWTGDAVAAAVVDALAAAGKQVLGTSGRTPNVRGAVHAALVTNEAWLAAMNVPIAAWRDQDSLVILAKARALAKRPPDGPPILSDAQKQRVLEILRARFFEAQEFAGQNEAALNNWISFAAELRWLWRYDPAGFIAAELRAWEQRPADLASLDPLHLVLFAHLFGPRRAP